MKKTKSKSVSKTSSKAVTKISPLGNRVLIRPFTREELEKKNSFGIILPGSDSEEKSDQGTVLAIGPGEYQDGRLVSVSLKVGDKVAFSKYGYEEIKSEDGDFYLIKEENVLAVLK